MHVLVAFVAALLAIPLGLDLYLPVPEANALSSDKIELGRRLFNDRRLSRDRSIGCASCHNPRRAFSNPRPISVGVFGRHGRRNVPALINRGYGRAFFWDGRIKTLEEQVLRPIEDADEMDLPASTAAVRVGLSVDELSKALASYVRSILSGDSPFDRFIDGDRNALSADQKAGLQIFRGKGNCTACHVGPTFSDEQLHNTGVAWINGALNDIGGGRGDFKTPTLREVARTSPYMHDGSLATLTDVVAFYSDGGRANLNRDPEMHPLELAASEKQALVEFLKALSGTVQDGAKLARP